jgi:benzylsuccinate CoA-transferase BbsF subunit
MTAGYLANYGATVVKVESSRSPDILRLTPPFRDGTPGLNNSHFCANMNASKLGVGLDMSRPEGQEIVLRLVEWADVVFESFTPKTLRGWGLDYEHLRARNPGIVMLSTCMQGQTGPRANYRGFGNLMGALSGYYQVTGWPDRGPTAVYGAYTDFICQRFCTTAVVAAIDHRHRTGEGQHIDVAQFEAALQFLGPELLDFELTGRVATRAGNRDPWRSPHGVFPCRPRPDGNEGWIAIACETDAQWAALCRTAGIPEDPAFADLAGRKADEDRLEALVAAWIAGHDADELFELLQPEVPCGPVLPVPALHDDPQVRHRGYWWPLVHTVIGEVPYDGLAATMSRTPGRLTKAGPCLGEDSYTVLTELAGLDPDTVARLLADEVVEITG